MHRTYRLSALAMALSALLLSSLAVLGLSPALAAEEADHAAGHVYVLNNNLCGQNSITIFTRVADGSLNQQGTTAIGGLGSVAAFADGTQGSLIRSRERTRLFAVDAGSDQISVVNVREKGQLALAGVFPSGGAGPVV